MIVMSSVEGANSTEAKNDWLNEDSNLPWMSE